MNAVFMYTDPNKKDSYFHEMLELSLDSIADYAERHGLDFVHSQRPVPSLIAPKCGEFARINLWKMEQIRECLDIYDRVLYVDTDVLIRPDSPNIFDLVPEDHWAAVDECDVAYRCNREDLIYLSHMGMSKVCREDGLPIPETQKRCFNCGVQIVSKIHQDLYVPAPHAQGEFGQAEQFRINVRLFLSDHKIYHLPDCWNAMMWSKTRRPERWAYFIHYVGLPYDQRAPMMKKHLEYWSSVYGNRLAS